MDWPTNYGYEPPVCYTGYGVALRGKDKPHNHIGELSIISDGRQDEGFAPIWNISISSCIKLFWLNIRLPILVEKPN